MKTAKSSLIALIFTALCFSPVFGGHLKDPMTAQLSGMSGAEFEAAYLAMMIHHHKDGVKMAEMVPNKAKSDQLKQMAADQQKEIGQMTGWLKQWHTKSPDDHKMPAESMKMMQEHMKELDAAQGDEFDKIFAKLMAHHHESAISMSQLAVEKAQHKEVKDMAKQIISSQTKESQELLKMSGSSSDGTAQYTCSMHPEVVQNSPGKCPKCGMKLEKKGS
jgi:uncharacterized protein (DUF305 family)